MFIIVTYIIPCSGSWLFFWISLHRKLSNIS